MSTSVNLSWDTRYAGDAFLFGTQPNAFLASQRFRLQSGQKVLAVADGEGRNGVWLAEQGLEVLSIDASIVAQQKARRLAKERQAKLDFELVDLEHWQFPANQYDLIVAIFIQFAGPDLRSRLFEQMKQALKPGGLIMLEGYGPKQLEYRTGGPSVVDNLYTVDVLEKAFFDFDILELRAYDAVIEEGTGHQGMSALVDLVARKPA